MIILSLEICDEMAHPKIYVLVNEFLSHYMICPNLVFTSTHCAASKVLQVLSKNFHFGLTPLTGLASYFVAFRLC